MKILYTLVAIACLFSASQAKADVVFSISNTDSAAGSDLQLQQGETGSMFVWISTEPGTTYAGIGLDILSSDAAILEGTNYEIFNPSLRWLNVETGDLGDMVTGSNAFALPGVAGTGLSTDGAFALFSEVQFSALEIGTTGLSFAVNSNGIGDLVGTVDPATITFGTGSVNVTAVPEPGSFAAIGLGGLAIGGYRRLRRKTPAVC